MRKKPSERADRSGSSHRSAEPRGSLDSILEHDTSGKIDSMLHAANRAVALALRLTKLDIEQRHLAGLRRSHYDPSQPRVPAGHPDGGQWTKTGSGGEGVVVSDAISGDEWRPGTRHVTRRGPFLVWIRGRPQQVEGGQAVRLLEAEARAIEAIARVRVREPNWKPRTFEDPDSVEAVIRGHLATAEEARARLREQAPVEDPPKVPWERPATAQERNFVAREIAQWMARNRPHNVQRPSWLLESEESVASYLDPPRRLEQLRQAVGTPRKGYDIHHIVEQTSAEQDGFPRSMIDSLQNLVRIPRYKHWEINAWSQTKAEEFGGMSPREYLRGRDWIERTAIGLEALVKHGVLKP